MNKNDLRLFTLKRCSYSSVTYLNLSLMFMFSAHLWRAKENPPPHSLSCPYSDVFQLTCGGQKELFLLCYPE